MTTTTINWSWGSTQTINFNTASDKLDFNWFQAQNFTIADSAQGVTITIPSNDQRYILAGVKLSQLDMSRNIAALDSGAFDKLQAAIAAPASGNTSSSTGQSGSQGSTTGSSGTSSGAVTPSVDSGAGTTQPGTGATEGSSQNGASATGSAAAKTVTITWRWGETIALGKSEFDPTHGDKLDFGWFQAGYFTVEEKSGSVEISIPTNQQRYVLQGVTLAQLSLDNIIAKDASAVLAWRTALGGKAAEPEAGSSTTTTPGQTTPGATAETGAGAHTGSDGGTGTNTGSGTSAGSNTGAGTGTGSSAHTGTEGSTGSTNAGTGTSNSGSTHTGADSGTGSNAGAGTNAGSGASGTDSAEHGGAYAKEWSANTVYQGGDRVAIHGKVYVAGWWTQNDDPSKSSNVVWKYAGLLDTTPVLASAPEDLAATAIKSNSVVLVWDKAEVNGYGNVSAYKIYDGNTLLATTTGTYLKLTDLEAGSTHSFTVSAVDEAGESLHSTAVSVTLATGDVHAGAGHEQYFSPYIDMSLSSSQDLVKVAKDAHISNFTLAFVMTGGAHSDAVQWGGLGGNIGAGVDTHWNGVTIKSQVDAIHALGGDVTISFGGAVGTEAAVQIASEMGGSTITQAAVDKLAAAYESVITRYDVHKLDFDIEGAAMQNHTANVLRAQAIAQLQAKYADVEFAYTLPVLTTGLTQDGIDILKVSKANGMRIDVVSIMAMDYYQGIEDMGQGAIDATLKTLSQVRSVGLDAKIGIIPMIGVNDTTAGMGGKEVFTVEDAYQLMAFADGNPDVSHISMWSIGRDHPGTGLSPAASGLADLQHYEFSKIFAAI